MHSSQSIEAGLIDASRRVLILHGYTGSPDSFRELAETIATTFGAHVSVPLLPGHGTQIEDLQKVSFDDFLTAARSHARDIAQDGKPFVIIGYCFGGYLAAILSDEFHPKAIVIGLTTYAPRFPFGIPGIAPLLALRSSWDKFLYKDEVEMRQPFFYYPRIPGRAQMLVNEGIERLKKVLPRLSMPILAMHTTEDPTVSPASGEKIVSTSGSNPNNTKIVLPNRRHALFFGPHKDEDIAIVIEFLKKNLQ